MAMVFFKVPFRVGMMGETGYVEKVTFLVETNVPEGDVIYKIENFVYGSGAKYEFPGGIGELELPTSVGANPTSFEYKITLEVYRVGMTRQVLGPYYMAAPATTADIPLANWPEVSSVPASWMTTATAQLTAAAQSALAPTVAAKDTAVAAAATATTAASTAASNVAGLIAADRAAVATDRAYVEAIVVTDLGTSDVQSAALVNTPTSETRAALNNAMGFLPASNGTGDAAVINALLTLHAGETIVGRVGETYVLESTILVPSNTTLNVTGCIMRRKTGTSGNLIRNAAAFGSGARDANVKVVGGLWDKNATAPGNPHGNHQMVFHKVDGLTVTDQTFIDAGTQSKYCCLVADATRFEVARQHYDNVPSDGFHLIGPASDGYIHDLTGKTGDDHFSITARDYSAFEPTVGGGDVENIVLERVTLNGSKAGPKILPGEGRVIRNVTVRDVRGWTAIGNGVTVVDDNANPSTTGGRAENITIENIDVTCPSSYASVLVAILGAGGSVGRVSIRNIALATANRCAVRLNGSIEAVTIDGFTARSPHTFRLIDAMGTANVETLAVRDLNLALSGAGCLLNSSPGSSIGQLTVSGGKVSGSSSLVFQGGAIDSTFLSALTMSGVTGISLSGVGAVADLTVSNITYTHPLLSVTGSGAAAILRGELKGTASTIYRSSTQSVRILGSTIRANGTHVAHSAGDMFYNTNAALPAGVGVLLSNGSAWKNLYTGATG